MCEVRFTSKQTTEALSLNLYIVMLRLSQLSRFAIFNRVASEQYSLTKYG